MIWNADHLKLSEADARGNTTSLTYDERGNMLTRTAPGEGTTVDTYDSQQTAY